MQPEVASTFFNQKWNKPLTSYRIIKVDYTFGKSVNVKEDAQKEEPGILFTTHSLRLQNLYRNPLPNKQLLLLWT